MRRLLGILAGLVFLCGVASAGDGKIYHNGRFGYAVEVPASFRWGPEAENGDGCRFSGPGGMVLLAYGSLDALGEGLAGELQGQKDAARTEGRGTLLGARMDPDGRGYVLQARGGGKLRCVRGIQGGQGEDRVFATVWLEVPLDRRKEGEALFRRLTAGGLRFP